MHKEERTYYEADFFAPGRARLHTLSNRLNNFDVYLLDASYKDKIEKNVSFRRSRYNTQFFKNQEKKPLETYAVRIRDTGHAAAQFEASRMNVQYTVEPYVKETTEFSPWLPIQNTPLFLINHKQHRLRYYANDLNKTKEIKELRNYCLELKTAFSKDHFASSKLKALNKFLDFLDVGDYEKFFSVLENPSDPIFKAITAPRPKVYSNKWFTIDFSAPARKNTTVFARLTDLISTVEYEEFRKEFKRQDGELNHLDNLRVSNPTSA